MPHARHRLERGSRSRSSASQRFTLREHEIEDIAEVRRAYLEPDGQVTVIRKRKDGKGGDGGGQRRQPL